MRKLTLNEKITFKGILARWHVPDYILIKLDMEHLMFCWYRLTGTSLIKYGKFIGRV